MHRVLAVAALAPAGCTSSSISDTRAVPGVRLFYWLGHSEVAVPRRSKDEIIDAPWVTESRPLWANKESVV